ncbi:MAG: adenylosuccinate lyase [Polaribacter sp.]
MSIPKITEELQNLGNAAKENRQRVANIVLANQEFFEPLVQVTFQVNESISVKAAWVLEWICTHHNLNCMIPQLTYFTKNIQYLTLDSAIRPCAKICEHLANAYYAKNDNEIKHHLTEEHIKSILETGFDWLITPQKIAVRAYTMNALYLFGLKYDWVHPELKHLIESKIIHESKGTKARGKQILNLIEKHQKSRS